MKRIRFKLLNLSTSLIAVALLLIFLHYLGVLRPVENLAMRWIEPAEALTNDLANKINNYFKFKAEQKNVFSENQELRDRVAKLTSDNIKLQILEKENETLKEELNFLEEKKSKFLIARIIGKSPDNQAVVILNRGRADGLETGLPVVTDNGIMVAKIIKVTENSSLASLLVDNQSKVAASILGQNQITSGVVEGEYGLSLKMDLIPKNQIIKVGDLIITSGLETSIPQGLIIGQVDHLSTEPNDIFQSATVTPYLSYDNLNIVAVLLP